MLTRENRLTSSQEFVRTVRRGRRAGTRTLVLHLGETPGPRARVGFVVSKAVGTAVVRNRVKRRLRHLARDRVRSLPGSVVLVVRALPAAAVADFQTLGADFDAALARLVGQLSTP